MPVVRRPNQPDLHYLFDDFTDPWASAPVLVLQHGFCRNARFWYQWVPHLARYFRVVRPDMRGVGQSGRDFDIAAELTLENLSGDLLAIADHVGASTLHFCGESLGGIAGIILAATHPERVRSLSLVATPANIGAPARERYSCGYGSWNEAIDRMGSAAWIRACTISTRLPPDSPPGMVDWFCDAVLEAGVDMLKGTGDLLLRSDATAFLSRIKAPVLALYPSGGTIASDAQKATLKAHGRNLRFEDLPTSYHMIQHILPGLCARHVRDFCASVDGRSYNE
jgi:3-oxoadipate enol-lactonase